MLAQNKDRKEVTLRHHKLFWVRTFFDTPQVSYVVLSVKEAALLRHCHIQTNVTQQMLFIYSAATVHTRLSPQHTSGICSASKSAYSSQIIMEIMET